MLALSSASASLWKGCALFGFKVAYFHASSICCEKRADKFRSSCRGDGHKEYVNYAKRKKRAAEKRDCLRWRSCEVYIRNFEELYWSRGVNFGKSQKQWSSGRHSSDKRFEDSDAHFGPTNNKRSGKTASHRASRKDPFQFMWQTANRFYSECWGDFFHQDFAFAHGSPFSRNRSSAGGFSAGDTDDHPGKKKVKVEPRTIGSPSDRQTLGLSPSGSLTIEELKKAFRASALKWHPDRHEDAAKVKAETKFKDCGAAYKSLLNALAKS
eukprot:c24215_g1_i1 orf=386-1189(-)